MVRWRHALTSMHIHTCAHVQAQTPSAASPTPQSHTHMQPARPHASKHALMHHPRTHAPKPPTPTSPSRPIAVSGIGAHALHNAIGINPEWNPVLIIGGIDASPRVARRPAVQQDHLHEKCTKCTSCASSWNQQDMGMQLSRFARSASSCEISKRSAVCVRALARARVRVRVRAWVGRG
jgi:hypothetical protein